MLLSDRGGRPEAVPLGQPGRVVGLAEGEQRPAQLLDGGEAPHPEQVLLERADEPLGAAVPFGGPNERRRAVDAREAQLPLEVAGHVLAAVVVAEREAAGDLLREAAEVAPHPLAERLERLEPVGTVAGVDADALGRAVVDGDEDGGLTLAGDRGGQVGAPHHVDRRGDDRAVVAARPARRAGPRRGEQVGLPHQPRHAPPRGADAAVAQAGPDLAVALAVEGARGQHRPDRFREVGARHRPGRSRPPRGGRPRRPAMPVDGRARDAPDAADQGEPVRHAGGRGGRPAHRLDLRRAKGRPASRAAISPSSSSCRSSISPSRAFSRSLASVSPSAGRVASAASPAARKASRHAVSAAAVTPSERETVSRSSPRRSRSTASRLRGRDIRPPRPGPTASVPVVSVIMVHLRCGRGPLTRCPVQPWAGGALTGAERLAQRVGVSPSRVSHLLPIDADRLESLSVEEDERVVAFLKRVEQLIVLAQDQLFTGLAVVSDVKAKLESRRDYAELMEKVGAVGSADTWRLANRLRNRLAHVYPVASERQAAILNETFALAPELVRDVDRLTAV